MRQDGAPAAPTECNVEAALTIDQAIAAFLGDLRLSGRVPVTIDSYARILPRLLRGLSLTSEITDRVLRGALLREYDRLAPTTRRLWYTRIAAFCAYLTREGYLAETPVSRIPKPSVPPPPTRALTPEEVRRVWAAARPWQRLALALLLEGLRVSELCELTIRDVDADAGTVRVRSRKTRQSRLVALSGPARAYLAARRPWMGDTLVGTSRVNVRRWMLALGERAGVRGRLTPHRLRHTWATEWLLAGGSEGALQTLGGWSTPDMIRQVYARGAVERAAVEQARRLGLSEQILHSVYNSGLTEDDTSGTV